MATAENQTGGRSLNIDLPDKREYENGEDAKLDEALVNAIKRAEDANNNYLSQLLRNELISHYYGSKIGL